jgi:hypothetical protein
MIAASEARTAYRLGHQSSPLFYSGGRVAQFLFFLSSVNEHERLFNITLRYKLKLRNITFIVVL